jgi:hypothetical protein
MKMAQSGTTHFKSSDDIKENKEVLPVYFFRFEDLITNPY